MGFLERVLKDKATEVAAKQSALPLDKMREQAETVAIRDFRAAVSGGGKIIAELKKKSPSAGRFVQSDDLFRLAKVYEQNGAAALSIVTDTPRFGTSLQDVVSIKEKVGLPVLVKDFVFDPYQIVEARAHGADAVLLIARILDRGRLASLLRLVRLLGIHALVETHDESDVAETLDAGASIIGVNNRDLDTMDVSLDTTRRLAGSIPENKLLVSESGIHTRDEIENLSAAGVDAFLIGRSLLGAGDPGKKLRSLLGAADYKNGRQQ